MIKKISKVFALLIFVCGISIVYISSAPGSVAGRGMILYVAMQLLGVAPA